MQEVPGHQRQRLTWGELECPSVKDGTVPIVGSACLQPTSCLWWPCCCPGAWTELLTGCWLEAWSVKGLSLSLFWAVGWEQVGPRLTPGDAGCGGQALAFPLMNGRVMKGPSCLGGCPGPRPALLARGRRGAVSFLCFSSSPVAGALPAVNA